MAKKLLPESVRRFVRRFLGVNEGDGLPTDTELEEAWIDTEKKNGRKMFKVTRFALIAAAAVAPIYRGAGETDSGYTPLDPIDYDGVAVKVMESLEPYEEK